MMILRHLLSILLLPFVVVVIVPWGLLSAFPADGSQGLSGLAHLVGGLLFLAGLGLFGWCVRLFATAGQGTLAPWDPTRSLVAAGPYAYMRNPMITGVAAMLIGQAIFWPSFAVAAWAGLFILINHAYFLLMEEPGLEVRFGTAYRAYKANVPRWLPRRTPWNGE